MIQVLSYSLKFAKHVSTAVFHNGTGHFKCFKTWAKLGRFMWAPSFAFAANYVLLFAKDSNELDIDNISWILRSLDKGFFFLHLHSAYATWKQRSLQNLSLKFASEC